VDKSVEKFRNRYQNNLKTETNSTNQLPAQAMFARILQNLIGSLRRAFRSYTS